MVFRNNTTKEYLKICFEISVRNNQINKFYIDDVYKNSRIIKFKRIDKTLIKSIRSNIINKNKYNCVEKHKQYKIKRIRNRC